MKKNAKHELFVGIAVLLTAMIALAACDSAAGGGSDDGGGDPDFGTAPFETLTVSDSSGTVTTANSWLWAVDRIKNGGNNKNYVVNVNADVTGIVGTRPYYDDDTFGTVTGVTVSLRGTGMLSLAGSSANGCLICIAASQTVILRGPTLSGKTDNTAGPVVFVRGTFIMTGGNIRDNFNNNAIWGGGGVYLQSGGTFTMSGGTISGNSSVPGGGVGIAQATFTMTGGVISGNSGYIGGGVRIMLVQNSYFSKTGGIIYGNDGGANKNFSSHGIAVYCQIDGPVVLTRLRDITAGQSDNMSATYVGADYSFGDGWGL